MIKSPSDNQMNSLCNSLGECTIDHSAERSWPGKQLELIGTAGVYRWFVPKSLGGLEWQGSEIVEGYIQLASACLTSTFVVTQRVAALRRICSSNNQALKNRILPSLLSGKQSATVGISHLTTSRRHLSKPVLCAALTEDSDIYRVNGFSPWVTGAFGADFLVMGAELEGELEGQQLLFAVERNASGITVEQGFELVGLTASQTGQVKCDSVQVDQSMVLAGPLPNVLASVSGNSTGGIQTSALALGLAKSAIDFLLTESTKRPGLEATCEALSNQFREVKNQLKQLANGVQVCTNDSIRTEANSLVLRATQAALMAAKGAGYVSGHPVGRWCQEALFFLVWSCPQSVVDANLCELAGIEN